MKKIIFFIILGIFSVNAQEEIIAEWDFNNSLEMSGGSYTGQGTTLNAFSDLTFDNGAIVFENFQSFTPNYLSDLNLLPTGKVNIALTFNSWQLTETSSNPKFMIRLKDINNNEVTKLRLGVTNQNEDYKATVNGSIFNNNSNGYFIGGGHFGPNSNSNSNKHTIGITLDFDNNTYEIWNNHPGNGFYFNNPARTGELIEIPNSIDSIQFSVNTEENESLSIDKIQISKGGIINQTTCENEYWLVGGAITDTGWDWTNPLKLDCTGNNVYRKIVHFNSTTPQLNNFRVFYQEGDWTAGLNWLHYVNEGYTIDALFENSLDEDNNFAFTGPNGNYYFEIDDINKTITLSPPNNTLIVDDISTQTSIASSKDITLLSNYGGVEFSIDTPPTHGEVVINGPIATYTPNTEFSGTDTFTYKATTSELSSNSGIVTVNVFDVPDLTLNIDKLEIGEHDSSKITATLSGTSPYDVAINLSATSGTATTDDYNLFDENGGIRYIKFEAYYSSDDGQVNLERIKAIDKNGVDVACGKSGYANSYENGGWANNGSNVTNCNGGYRWSSNRNDPGPNEENPHFIVVDLEDYYDLERIEIKGNGWDMSYSVLTSSDNINWENLGTYYNTYLGDKSFNDLSSNSFIIPQGEVTATFIVKGIEDGIQEGTETLTISPQVTNANLVSDATFTIDILDVNISFTLKDDVFVGFNNAEFAWGDYDLDGDFDVAIMGDKGNGLETLIYENTEINGVREFINTNQNFEKIGYGTLEWVDLDKDGYVDLFVSGLSQTTGKPTSVLYKNTIADQMQYFEADNSYNFPQLIQTQVDFGDLDNDGDVDYVISGYNESEQLVAFYGFQDHTTNSFELINTNFNGFENGDLKIFDADSDGDNDVIAATGNTKNSYLVNNNNYKVPNRFFQNIAYFTRAASDKLHYITLGGMDTYDVSASGNFISSAMSRNNGDITIADFNNDGIEDLFITGKNSNDIGESTLYIGANAYNASYTASTEFTFEPLVNATCEWVDYDNDGDLDLFLAGLKTGEGLKTLLYETEVTNKKNTPPAKITNLTTTDLGDGNIKLEWEAPQDDFNAIMGYNIRLGTSPGGDELSYLLSNPSTGDLLVSKTPTVFNTFYNIQLDPGVYYWSVQAVDKGFKASPFSDEQNFTHVYNWKILNQGGIVDKTIPAQNNPILEFLDLDNDNDYDLIYGQSGNGSKVFSYQDGLLSYNNNFNFNSQIQEFEIGDLNNDGSLDVIGMIGSTQNVAYLSGNNATSFSIAELFDRKQQVADLNNDGKLEVLNFGVTSTNEFFAKFNLYTSLLDANESGFNTTDLSNNFESISQMFSPSFDAGDYDNDQDIDLVISGDLIFGENITKIFENTTQPGSQTITFTETANNIPGVKDGSSTFIDFDSDGDLDLLISGKDNVDNDVFDLYLNTGDGNWPKVETNLPAMENTQLEMGDFNGDGLLDVLISGLTSEGEITKLMEYVVNQGFIESSYDLGDFASTKFGFGDLDGDNDLDFVISGSSSTNNQPLFRVYLNYRSESATVLENNNSISRSASQSFVKNQPPSKPGTPYANLLSKDGNTSIVEIAWNGSYDDSTPSAALSYALRLGSSPGSEDIIASGASQSGFRKYAGKGNAEHNTSWKIALTPGVYYAAVQAIDAAFSGSEFSNEYVIEVKQDGTLGVNNNGLNALKVYPNPSKNILNIAINNEMTVESVKISDLLGKTYNSKPVINDSALQINVSKLSKGYYVLEVAFSNGKSFTEKFIKN